VAATDVKQRLAQDVGQWVADGLIDAKAAELLRERWSQPSLGLSQIIKYIGYSGGLLALFGLLGLVGARSSSAGVAAVELTGVGGGLLWWGVQLALDGRGRYAQSSKMVVALGFVTFALGCGVLANALGMSQMASVFASGLLALPVAFGLAYRFRNTFLLILGLLGFYHWVGSWSSMLGRSTYSIEVQDPYLMMVAAGLGAAFGAAHRRLFPHTAPSFAHCWEAVGLTYLNLSLLILSIGWHHNLAALWIVVWAVAGVAQIVAGARLHDGVFTGFGVTAVIINLYTRYFEKFWDQTDAGLFFFIGGVSLFGTGFAIEWWARRNPALRTEDAP
jgi:hypothetical protein